jgi:pilus retraction protein PilT
MNKKILLSDIIKEIVSLGMTFTDIHIESDMPIMLRVSFGEWQPFVGEDGELVVASKSMLLAFINGIYTGKEEVNMAKHELLPWEKAFKARGSLHPAVTLADSSGLAVRMRCSIQRQAMGESIAMVVRPLAPVPQSVEALGLPIQVEQVVTAATHGLIIVTGPTGSGKSTSIAAMVEMINKTKAVNIITIEDPIEYIYERNKAIINQRELFYDCPSFYDGIRDALRFVPEVIVVGEIRDAETMKATVRAAESGHLVLSTMHAPTTVSAIRKMIALLGGEFADTQVLLSNLVAIVAQALVRRKTVSDGWPNILAYEFLNLKEKNVASIIQNYSNNSDSLNQLEQNIKKGVHNLKSMAEILRIFVSQNKIDKHVAAHVCPYIDERASILNL